MTQRKNKYLIHFVISWTFLFITACGPSSPEEKMIQVMHDKIMVVHDEVMPKMSDIYKLRKHLQKQDNIQTKEARDKAVEQLDIAEEAMMEWMAQYDKPSPSKEGFKEYLEEQLISVTVMKKTMLDALETAEKLKND